MNIIDAARTLLVEDASDNISSIDDMAVAVLSSFVDRYDALAPTPEMWANDAPTWAQWYAIDATGTRFWHKTEPIFLTYMWRTRRYWNAGGVLELLIGVDWRLCKWERK